MSIRNCLLFFLIVLLCFKPTFSQNEDLEKQNFKDLIGLHYTTKDSVEDFKYALTIIEKGKKLNDFKKVATGYFLLSTSYEDKRAIIYSDSIITLTEGESSYSSQPATAYLTKAIYYINLFDFKKAIDNISEANRYATLHKNNYVLKRSKSLLGYIKINLGLYDDALEIFHKNLYLSKRDTLKKNYKSFLFDWYSVASAHNEKRALDSAKYYNTKGLRISKRLKNSRMDNYFNYNIALTNYHSKNYVLAKNKLESSIDFLKKENDITNLLEARYYLGKAYLKLENKNFAISNFIKIDSFYNQTRNIYPTFRNTYYELINLSNGENEKFKKIDYIDKLIEIDSLTFSNNLYLNNKINSDFEIPKLVEEKDFLIKSLDEKSGIKTVFIKLFVTIIIILLVGICFQFYQNNKFRKKAKILLATIKKDEPYRDSKVLNVHRQTRTLDIPENIISETLLNLETFENSNGFLDQDLNLQKLSKIVKSNTKYLSKIINNHKLMSYNNYINGLRIDYSIEKLKTSNKFRSFTIVAVAEDCGFKNPESFSKAFSKATGVKPSFFITELKKDSL